MTIKNPPTPTGMYRAKCSVCGDLGPARFNPGAACGYVLVLGWSLAPGHDLLAETRNLICPKCVKTLRTAPTPRNEHANK